MWVIDRVNVVVAGLCLFAAAASALADDWPHWRGPNHDGQSGEKNFKTTWGKSEPKVLWERELGPAYSSFACVGDRVYTCGTKGGKQVLFCLDVETGKDVWSKPFDEGYTDGQGDGTRATPTVDGSRVYIFGTHGQLACHDAKTGKQIWTRKFNDKPQWGYAGSVLIQGDLAIVSPGKPAGGLCALNKKTGEPVWKCGDDVAGYATPYPFTFKGKRYICGFLGNSAIIAELETGKQVFSMPWKTDWKVNAAAPIFHEGYLFLSSGYSTGCGLFKLRAEGDALSAEEIWRSKVLLNKFQTPVLHRGKLYSSDQKALKCVDFMTGERHWRKRRVKHGTVVYANGHLILLTEKGELRIAKANPEGFKSSAKARVLEGQCWTVPVLSGGRLYARNFEKAICIDLRK